MKEFSISPMEMISSLWRNRNLGLALVKREVIGRYRGSALGLLWSFLTPVLMLIVYTFIFSVVFKTKWGGGTGSKAEFALILFAGLLVFNFFSECIGRAPNLIIANGNYVKKVIFPLEILPFVSIGAALFHTFVSFLVWLIFYLLFLGKLHFTLLLFPIALLPLVLMALGISWFLASLGVYIRDVGQVIGVFITMLMFLSPIFYPVSALPEKFQLVMHLNPLTSVIEQVREILISETVPNIGWFLANLLISAIFTCLGFMWFQKTRKGFADVL